MSRAATIPPSTKKSAPKRDTVPTPPPESAVRAMPWRRPTALDVEAEAVGLSRPGIGNLREYSTGDLLAEVLGIEPADIVGSGIEAVLDLFLLLEQNFETENVARATITPEKLNAIVYAIGRRLAVLREVHRRQREALHDYVHKLEERARKEAV